MTADNTKKEFVKGKLYKWHGRVCAGTIAMYMDVTPHPHYRQWMVLHCNQCMDHHCMGRVTMLWSNDGECWKEL